MDFDAMQGVSLLVLFEAYFLDELDDWWVVQHYLFDPGVRLLEDSELELVWVRYDVLDDLQQGLEDLRELLSDPRVLLHQFVLQNLNGS